MARDVLNNNNESSNNQGENRLIADPELHPNTLAGGGRRTIVLHTQKGTITIDLEKRLVRLLIILSDVLREQLSQPSSCDQHKGRISAEEIGKRIGTLTDWDLNAEVIVAYIAAINKAIRKAARDAKIPPPQIISSGWGGYRIFRPFPKLADAPSHPNLGGPTHNRAIA